MTYAVRATIEAAADLDLLYGFILERDATDFTLAEAAIQALRDASVRRLRVAKRDPTRPSSKN
ncbi:hypothetical protein [Caballeronia terrestris]|uniref:hypothetical protein n=1 Tax=Caballeronia terrestris TaxID=1226301 RepID=UPI000A45A1C6